MRHELQQTSCPQLRKKKLLPLILPLLLIMMMMAITCVSAMSDIEKSSSVTSSFHLRGGQHSNNNHHLEIDDTTSSRLHHEYQQPLRQQDQQHRSTKEANDVSSSSSNANSNSNNSTTLLLTQPLTFQIIITTLLTLLILLQLLLLITFFHQRSKRVLEFAQPFVICIFITCSIMTTSSCYFYLYVTSVTCAIREPIVFVFVSCMGATVGGRAWRISTLLNNPLLTAGRGGGGNNGSSSSSVIPRVERARQLTLRILSVLSGCEYSVVGLLKDGRNASSGGGGRGGRPIRVQITSLQMMRATLFMILPQLIWQVVVLSVPMLRSSRELASYTFVAAGGGMNNNGLVTMEQYQCQSSVGFWPNYVSILLTLFPYAIAYLLNVRPKSELDQLPEMINERDHLKHSFSIFVRVLVVALPMIGLTLKNNPSAKAYGAICAVLGLPLACCYHIAYVKLNSTKSNITKQQGMSSSRSAASSVMNDDANGRSNAALAVRMAEMYSRIGRVEETVQLVDETLGVFRKGNSGNHLGNLGGLQGDGRQEVASGFTVNDLKALEGDELQMIIQLLRLKGNALIKLKGPAGFAMSAKLNIDALKIFENCPAANKMKDISLMFPIYNMVGIQLKGGVIDQDDECSLEMDLAERFCHEAQLQAFHYARALANLAEMYGRVGMLDEAFKYFHIMKAVYMTQDHPKLLLEGYAVDRCAVNFASSALWYLQKGEIDNAIERCDYVIDHILPHYDEKDFIGLYHIFIPLIRVLKWNGQVEKAREAYHTYISDSVESHFAVGTIHKPMGLLLRICEGSSHEYNMDHIPGDIELALSFDMSDE